MKNKSKKNLILAATAMGLSIGIQFDQNADAAVFAKYEGVDGESKDDAHEGWIELRSYLGTSGDGLKVRVKGKVLLIKDKKGRYGPAKNGEYILKNGRKILVKKGVIVKPERKKAAPKGKTKPERESR